MLKVAPVATTTDYTRGVNGYASVQQNSTAGSK